ncbi:hypothetical protein [Aquimarina agarilytica]|uniref:hypothetical protein n=1 Tax=Aquimarina agarilytica TaxID=1087449 RepID=UPI00028902AB|nr:hypothetical protein [Aquimarina agarilytica]
MKLFNTLFLFFIVNSILAQHEPGAWVVGVQGAAKVDRISDVGGSFQVHYAPNCYSTYIAEVGVLNTKDGIVPELGITINSIMFNFQSWMITGGMGFIMNSAELSKKEQDDAIFAFSDGKNSFGALLKIRTLVPINKWWQLSSAFNFKSVGGKFSTVTLGIIYEFPLKGY